MNVSIEGSNPSFSVERAEAAQAPPPLPSASREKCVYGVVVQTFASVWLTRIVPPGPSFHAYQLPFCETAQ